MRWPSNICEAVGLALDQYPIDRARQHRLICDWVDVDLCRALDSRTQYTSDYYVVYGFIGVVVVELYRGLDRADHRSEAIECVVESVKDVLLRREMDCYGSFAGDIQMYVRDRIMSITKDMANSVPKNNT